MKVFLIAAYPTDKIKGRRCYMDKVKVYYNNEADPMDIWFGNHEDDALVDHILE